MGTDQENPDGATNDREMKRRPSVLVSHHWMGRGGSEATAMWTLRALQHEFDVTFVTASPVDWDDLNAAYGAEVIPELITLRRAPNLPLVKRPERLIHLRLRQFERHCQSIAHEYDICLSAYNPIDFGRPAIQLIGDFSFSEEMRKRLYIHGESQFCHKDSWVRRAYIDMVSASGVKLRPLAERGDLILANSAWTVAQLDEFFGVRDAPIIYPPVILPKAPAESVRDPFGFVCLGRVVPEKEIERIVRILSAVRELGYPVKLRLIGNLDASPYSRRIAELIEQHSHWITPEGFLDLDEKQAVLASQTFALHACRIEAFGIAVAEMASMGCVPFVPSSGGAGEIVSDPRLQFDDDADAMEKIIAMLTSPEEVAAIRRDLPETMNRFGPEIFTEEIRGWVREFADHDASSVNEVTPKNCAAVR